MLLPLRGVATPGHGEGEGSAVDKFRVSGTQETVEGAGANEVSGVLSEASCCRCGAPLIKKKRPTLFSRPLFGFVRHENLIRTKYPYSLCSNTVAQTSQPSLRPTKPSFSVVVALTEIRSVSQPRTSASVSRILRMYPASFGA